MYVGTVCTTIRNKTQQKRALYWHPLFRAFDRCVSRCLAAATLPCRRRCCRRSRSSRSSRSSSNGMMMKHKPSLCLLSGVLSGRTRQSKSMYVQYARQSGITHNKKGPCAGTVRYRRQNFEAYSKRPSPPPPPPPPPRPRPQPEMHGGGEVAQAKTHQRYTGNTKQCTQNLSTFASANGFVEPSPSFGSPARSSLPENGHETTLPAEPRPTLR